MPEDFRQVLREEVLIADGAYGTTMRARNLLPPDTPGPALNLIQPAFVSALHREYIDAGARLIKTNTFQAHRVGLARFNQAHLVNEINSAGARLAKSVAGDDVWVAAAIGPIGFAANDMSDHECLEVYREQAAALHEGGVGAFLLETFSDLAAIELAVQAVRSIDEQIPIIAQMAFSVAGVTARGVTPAKAITSLQKLPVDVIGANCGGGESTALRFLREVLSHTDKPLSVYPNRGLAALDEQGEPQYQPGPDYFAEVGAQLAELGANVVGGCCGTTPVDIEALTKAVGSKRPAARKIASVSVRAAPARKKPDISHQSPVVELDAEGIAVVTEVDSPKGYDCAKAIEGVRELMAAGVDSITVGDNPLSIVRMSNLAFASRLIRETGSNVTLHLSCRDRNTIGNQSFLLGAAGLGIRNVLVITGDPVATDAYPGSKGVFNSASVPLMQLISRMNEGEISIGGKQELHTDFCIGGAFNTGARSYDAEMSKLKRKVDAGMRYVLTQPVFDVETAERILDLVEPLDVKCFIGIMPFLSERNARFLHNEVPGINVPDAVLTRMKGKKGKTGRNEGMAHARELIDAVAERSRAIYLISQMERYDMTAELARYAKSIVPRGEAMPR